STSTEIDDPRAGPIGYSGSAGSGPHLHWEIKQFPQAAISQGPGYTQQHSSSQTDSVAFGGVVYMRPTAFVRAHQVSQTGSVNISATLDGISWSTMEPGTLSYILTCAGEQKSGISVPANFPSETPGACSVGNIAGGPPNSVI